MTTTEREAVRSSGLEHDPRDALIDALYGTIQQQQMALAALMAEREKSTSAQRAEALQKANIKLRADVARLEEQASDDDEALNHLRARVAFLEDERDHARREVKRVTEQRDQLHDKLHKARQEAQRRTVAAAEVERHQIGVNARRTNGRNLTTRFRMSPEQHGTASAILRSLVLANIIDGFDIDTHPNATTKEN